MLNSVQFNPAETVSGLDRKKCLYILLILLVVTPFDLLGTGVTVAPWFALFLGIVYALVLSVLILNSTRRLPNICSRLRWSDSVSA